MSDPTLCRGVDADGKQCICLRAKDTYVDPDNRTRCTNCDHIESAHPEERPSATSFVKGFRDAAKLGSFSSSVKASQAEAEAETSAGLRPKKREIVKYGKAICLPGSLYSDGTLRRVKLPPPQELEEMRAAGLVVWSAPSRPLSLDTAWDNGETNAEMARLFPKATAFVAHQQSRFASPNDPPEKKQLWLAAIVYRQSVTLASDPFPTAAELANHCKVLGRPVTDRVVYIVPKNKIPEHRWKNWDQVDSDDLGSEVDTVPSEDLIVTPRKSVHRKKLKIKAEPGLDADSDGQESDMRKAAKMRTRLSSGAIKKKALFIPGSSDVEGEPQAGPSGSSKDIVEVSDDDEELFPFALAGSGRSPLRTKSPSPAPSLPHPHHPFNPPSFYDDFSIHSPPPPPQTSSSSIFGGPPIASSSTSMTGIATAISPFTWTSPFGAPGPESNSVPTAAKREIREV
ncbi:hypothetical protein B0H11DRAFT_2235681 [Mycena galericulata]|nr:hypothetical protein B0H11DRAFT_2235681 [Mycena galericulata]